MSPRRRPTPTQAPDEAQGTVRGLLDRLEDPPAPPAAAGGRAEVLAGRFGQTERTWEQRHVRWTVWIDADLRDQITIKARAEGRSVRDVVEELLRAGLNAGR